MTFVNFKHVLLRVEHSVGNGSLGIQIFTTIINATYDLARDIDDII